MATAAESRKPKSRQEKAAEILAGLAHFTGGDERFSHYLRRMNYTGGIQYLAEAAGAYWLIDAVASHQNSRKIRENQRLQEFQLWELKVAADRSAIVTCREDSGSDDKPIIRQRIEYTDFPLDEIRLYVEGGVLLLPSEH